MHTTMDTYRYEDLFQKEGHAKEVLEGFRFHSETCDEEGLISLHNQTKVKLKFPSYLLRFLFFGKEHELTDKGLHVLLEAGSDYAYYTLKERHGLDVKKQPDEFFVIGAQKNGKGAIEKEILTEKYKDYIKRINGYYLRGSEKDDLLQEAFIGFLKAIDAYKIERGTKFKIFSRYVIERRLGTLLKRSKNKRNRALNDSLSFNTPVNSDSDSTTFEDFIEGEQSLPEERLINKETLDELLEIFTGNERQVLQYYAQGYSYAEVAAIIGKSRKSVDNAIRRFRIKGHEYMEEFLNSPV